MPIAVNNKVYRIVRYESDDSFEKDVRVSSDLIFGTKTIYLDLKNKNVGEGITVIPDGTSLDFTIESDAKFYIVENEIVSHDPFKHIGIQLLKFATSFDGERVRVRNLIMDEISRIPDPPPPHPCPSDIPHIAPHAPALSSIPLT